MEALTTAGSTPGAQHHKYVVGADEDVGELRRAVAKAAAGMSQALASSAALAATELGTNLLRYGVEGYVLVRALAGGLELLAVDRGPGMTPPQSTDLGRAPLSSSLGIGLGAVRRAATVFDLYTYRAGGGGTSAPSGTVILAQLLEKPAQPAWYRWGAVNVPIEGGSVSGDGWALSDLPAPRTVQQEVGEAYEGGLSAVVVDGLGHGTEAHDAAAAALSAFAASPGESLEELVGRAHEAMRPTRGGVLALCSVNPARGELRYGAIGNVAGMLLQQGTSQRLLSHDGTLGTSLLPPSARVASYPWLPGAVLVVASDGLRSSWDPLAYPGLLAHHPAVVAAVLQRDYGRPNDDATVLVVRDLRASRPEVPEAICAPAARPAGRHSASIGTERAAPPDEATTFMRT